MSNKKRITVFTPTYNRAHTLGRLYESLKKQTNKEFIWLIIDDGSTDNTKDLINNWINEKNEFDIKYYYKENGGMHTAHNVAFEKCTTELVFCLDSDDDLTEDAIEKILYVWEKRDYNRKIVGIIANEQYRTTKQIIGKELPNNLKYITFFDAYYKYHVSGDKVLIYQTEIIKENPYPEFKGERFVPLSCKYLEIDDPLIILNDAIINKEYLDDGYTKNIMSVYLNNPNGFLYQKKKLLKKLSFFHNPIKTSKTVIHYIAFNLLIKNKKIIVGSPKKILTAFLFILGYIWYKKLYSFKTNNIRNFEIKNQK